MPLGLERLVRRLVAEDGLRCPAAARQAIADYERWFADPSGPAPDQDVDRVWQRHMLDTAAYAADCQRQLGAHLHRRTRDGVAVPVLGPAPVDGGPTSTALEDEDLTAVLARARDALARKPVRLPWMDEAAALIDDDPAGAEREYRRFLQLVISHPKGSVPCKLVDELWHQHILDSEAYVAFCDRVAGRYLHHLPHYEETHDFHAPRFDATRDAYARRFGEPPPAPVWGHMGESGGCGGCGGCGGGGCSSGGGTSVAGGCVALEGCLGIIASPVGLSVAAVLLSYGVAQHAPFAVRVFGALGLLALIVGTWVLQTRELQRDDPDATWLHAVFGDGRASLPHLCGALCCVAMLYHAATSHRPTPTPRPSRPARPAPPTPHQRWTQRLAKATTLGEQVSLGKRLLATDPDLSHLAEAIFLRAMRGTPAERALAAELVLGGLPLTDAVAEGLESLEEPLRIRALRSVTGPRRELALGRLRRTPAPVVRQILLDRRSDAAIELTALGPPVIDALVPYLNTPGWTRNTTYQAILKMGPAALPYLERHTTSRHVRTLIAAIRSPR